MLFEMDIKFIPYGENAYLINFPQEITVENHKRVFQIFQALQGVENITGLIPAYCSLVIQFDAQKTSHGEIKHLVRQSTSATSRNRKEKSRRIQVPVCYDGDFAPDLAEVSRHTELPREEIIAIHSTGIYRVFMLGFIPGFPYMGVLPKEIQCPRKETPRLSVPAGAIGIAGAQTGIYPSEVPGGWQIIGRTPYPIFHPIANDPFLFRPGDEVQFLSIDQDTFLEMSAWVDQDELEKFKMIR